MISFKEFQTVIYEISKMPAVALGILLSVFLFSNTPIPLDGVSATIRIFGQNDTKRGRNAKSVAETQRAQ